jgi:hypothetical protein
MQAEPLCLKCRQPLPPGVEFCACCGFDNASMARTQEMISFDEQIEKRLAWLRLEQLLRWLWWRLRP